jgi:MOSC domain-containing protein YiiM
METSPVHRTADELAAGLAEILATPCESGQLAAIYLRPNEDQRQTVTTAELTPAGGIAGDRWAENHWQKLPDGSSDPISQISVMNLRVLRLLAADEPSMALAGDNLIVELDLSEENFPAGSQLKIGDQVVLEFTPEAHTGCRKFSLRYGQAAKEFINGAEGKLRNFRGRYARIIQGGTIGQGDLAVKVS